MLTLTTAASLVLPAIALLTLSLLLMFSNTVVALEDYLRRKLFQSRELSRQNSVSEISQECCSILDLPDEILLNILSYLDTRELCKCSSVCRTFHEVGGDEILWQHKLNRDIKTWTRLESRPKSENRSSETMSAKQTYLRWCPSTQVNKTAGWNLTLERITTYIKSWKKKNPRFALLGSGIESKRTSKIVRAIVHNRIGEQFEPVNMITGHNGIGSGISYKLRVLGTGDFFFDLLTLYTSRREDRERVENQRIRISRSLLLRSKTSSEDNQESLGYELTPSVRELFATINGIIYAIDAEDTVEEILELKTEIDAVCSSMAPDNPLLILSLVGKPTNQRTLSPYDLVSLLGLTKLTRPWCVLNSVSNQLDGLGESIVWMIQYT